MKKLGLNLDELQVETFEVEEKVAGRGTVLGHEDPSVNTCRVSCICLDTVYTNNDPTCGFSCDCPSRIACPPTDNEHC
ncbi:MAG TPA: hypothetical protein VNP72_05580 [Longimicrobium sp.]|nr:hypothetical protein [Longimicrobium sp.]